MCSHHASRICCANDRCRRPMPEWVAKLTRRHFGRPLCPFCTPTPMPRRRIPRGIVINVSHLVSGPRPVPVLLREEVTRG
ncbi:MAG: hypothetical protein ACK47B_10740 [Armatimonadota bacterium]